MKIDNPTVTMHSVEKQEIHGHANYFPSNQIIVKFFI